jgi:ArsR family transcriptional regulator, zinc-responsive transcriptional repressor
MSVDQLPTRSALEKAADCLRTLGHPARLEMCLLIDAGQYNVGQIAEACGIPSHVASEHLRLMERCGLLHRNRVGRETFYRIAEPSLRDILSCIGRRFGPSAKRRKKP